MVVFLILFVTVELRKMVWSELPSIRVPIMDLDLFIRSLPPFPPDFLILKNGAAYNLFFRSLTESMMAEFGVVSFYRVTTDRQQKFLQQPLVIQISCSSGLF